MEYEIWNMKYGRMPYGIWNMEYGIWNMEGWNMEGWNRGIGEGTPEE